MKLDPRGFVLGLLVAAAACGGSAPRYASIYGPQGAVRYDQDGDGAYGPWVCPVGVSGCDAEALNQQPVAMLDCDDHDAKRYPGAPDPEGDGIDQNCDNVDGIAPAPGVTVPAPAAGTAGDGSPLLPLQQAAPSVTGT